MVERFLNNSAPICKILTRELIKDQITTIRFFHSLKPLSPGIVQEARSFDKTDAILQNRNNEAVSVIDPSVGNNLASNHSLAEIWRRPW